MVAGSVPRVWHFAVQVKESSCEDEELPQGALGMSKLCCCHLGFVVVLDNKSIKPLDPPGNILPVCSCRVSLSE